MSAEVFLAYNANDVKPGWVAFWIVVALAVATYLLWRSMNNQLGKIRMPPRPRERPGVDGRRPPVAPTGDDPVDPPPDDDDPRR
jgi:hypothetical protein